MQFEIFYEPKFDIRHKEKNHYFSKNAPTSLHSFIRKKLAAGGEKILDIGGGDGESVSSELSKNNEVVCADQFGGEFSTTFKKVKIDLDGDWEILGKKNYSTVLALDVIEHLKIPEEGVVKIRKTLQSKGILLASTGNVAFIIIRFMLFLGCFNYGRRGILDLTHTRLMTKSSFRRLLENGGFKVEKIIGFGVPLEDLKPGSFLFKILDRLSYFAAKIWPRMFAFQLLAICRKEKDIDDLIELTFK